MMRLKKTAVGFLVFFILFNHASCEDTSKDSAALFDYQKILKKKFREGVGSVVPVTIEQSVEVDGALTRDGFYFFYASDLDRGNYDIYLRSLTDITTVRITNHASKDTSPSISPNGKYLAFISKREDPEGDIYVVDVDAKEIIEEAKSSVTGVSTLDSEAINITQYQEPRTKIIRIVKDSSPCWSPDSKWIAFSSIRDDGLENIWLIDRKGNNLTRVTKKGGVSPGFSADGRYIIYISYRDKGSNGDVYIINILTGKERRITESASIEMHPSFMSNSDEIVYTLIDRDTNEDNKINLKDNSIIYYKNIKTGEEYPLTTYSKSSFAPEWSCLPEKNEYQEIVIFSNQAGRNININIIPAYGIVPRKRSARKQFDLANKFLNELDDVERHIFCLERTYQFFGKKKDLSSIVFVSRALFKAAMKYNESGFEKDALRIRSLLSSLSNNNNDYRKVTSRYLDKILAGKSGEKVILNAVKRLRNDKKNKVYIPYLLEDMGDEYFRLGRSDEAAGIFRKIINQYPKYKRIMYLHYKTANLSNNALQKDIDPSYLKVLESKFISMRNDTVKRLLVSFDREKNLSRRLKILKVMLKKYKDRKKLPGVIEFVLGKTYYGMKNFSNAKTHLLKALGLVTDKEIIFYKSNILLGNIAEEEKRPGDFEKYYYLAAKKYSIEWKQSNIFVIINKLIHHYETYGERAEASGNYKAAVSLYEKYVEILTRINLTKEIRKEFGEIYNEYAARAHVLYIEAYSAWQGRNLSKLSELEKQYIKRLPIARMDFDKAHIYGLGYIYTKMALVLEQERSSLISSVKGLISSDIQGVLERFKKAIDQIEWSLFIDDTFIDPYILKGWIYQYVDILREKDSRENDGENEEEFGRFFPEYLWESNVDMYEKALIYNDEALNPEKEGNLHLNIANTYFLLKDYPGSLSHYKLAGKYKKSFNSKVEEALFHYHFGYCLWQEDQIDKAREELNKTLYIYEALSSGNVQRYKNQVYILYRLFALFNRIDKRYGHAIKWYNRILVFANVNKIDIDRVRYYQEIAYCYTKSGHPQKALFFLDRAAELLEKYKDDEKKYYVEWKILGLGPIPFYDLGADGAVIGENRIFTELDTLSMRLLNVSMKVDIFLSRSNYLKSIELLMKKLNLLEDRGKKADHEMKIRALTNIGYCCFKLRRYKQAGVYYRLAWEYAADSDVDNQEGIFTSIMNICSLYAFMLENNIDYLKQPVKEIESLTGRIFEYRDNYKKKRLVQELEKLQLRAEKLNREVKDEDIGALKDKINKEAKEKYSTLDIAIGVLKYYKAEILYNTLQVKDSESNKNRIERAFSIYKTNKNIFNLYWDAKKRFENALIKAEARKSRRLNIKLLLNLSACEERIGLFDEAYENLISAQDIVDVYEYPDLLWNVYYKIGEFLYKYGMEVEGEEYQEISEEYYSEAAAIIEELPYLYSGNFDKIKNLYDDYIKLLIDRRKWEKALILSEKKYAIARMFLISLSTPELFNKNDRDHISNFSGIMKEIADLRNEISLSLETSGGANSEKVRSLKLELKNRKEKLKGLIHYIKKQSPLVASYISISNFDIPDDEDTLIYKFIEIDGKRYAWDIAPGEIEFRELSQSKNDSLPDLVSQYMNEEREEDWTHRFVVLNDTSLEIFRNLGANLKAPPFMFVPSIERAKYFTSSDNITLSSIYFNREGLKGRLSKVDGPDNINVDEGEIKDVNLAKYSILVDGTNEITTSRLFSERIEPTLLIKGGEKFDSDYIIPLVESSLYSGIKTIYLSDDMNVDLISDLIKNAMEKPFNNAQIGISSTGNVIAIGFSGLEKSKRLKELPELKNKEYNKFLLNLNRCNLSEAGIHLERWHGTGESKPEDGVLYYINLAEIEALKENYAKSQDYYSRAMKLAGGKFPELLKQALSGRIYLLLQNGNISAARALIAKDGGLAGFSDSLDYSIYKRVIKLASDGAPSSANKFNPYSPERTSILPLDKLKYLQAEYFHLFDLDNDARKVLANWEGNYSLSTRDALKILTLRGRDRGINISSKRAGDIAGLLSETVHSRDKGAGDIRNKLTMFVKVDGKYDSLSPHAVYFALKKVIDTNRIETATSLFSEINIGEMAKESHWMDMIHLLSFFKQVCVSEKKYEDALTMTNYLLRIVEGKRMPMLIREILYEKGRMLSALERYKESFEVSNRGVGLVDKNDDLLIKFQLLLMENEIYLGKTNEATKREEYVTSIIKAEFSYVLDLLKARITLLRILQKKASASQWGRVEKLILKALDTLDASPDILKKFNRIDLINDNLDFLISYKMSRRDYLKALVYAEIKKQILLRSKMPGLVSPDRLPRRAIKEFKKIENIKNERRFIDLLQRYPELQAGALIKILPVGKFRKHLPDNSVVLYLVRNSSDILGWILEKKSSASFRIKDGFTRADEIIKRYREKCIQVENTIRISEDLYKLFKPLEKYYKKKELIILITDRDLEPVPFEIIGRRDLLEESHTLVYLSSIMSGLRKYNSGKRIVNLELARRKSIFHELEEVALRESGIPYKISHVITSGIGHLQGSIIYNSMRRGFYLGDRLYNSHIKGAEIIYIPSADFIGQAGYSDFSTANSMGGVKGVVINDAEFHDVNNAIFVDNFYKAVNEGGNYIQAFEKAKNSIRKNARFKHPAYWAGIRFYLNGI